MLRKLAILALIPFILFLTSCTIRTVKATKGVIEGTTKGTAKILEGVGRGVYEGTKGVAEATIGVGKSIGGEVRQDELAAQEAQEEATAAGGEAIKGIVMEPLEGVVGGLGELGKGLKEAVSDEEIK